MAKIMAIINLPVFSWLVLTSKPGDDMTSSIIVFLTLMGLFCFGVYYDWVRAERRRKKRYWRDDV